MLCTVDILDIYSFYFERVVLVSRGFFSLLKDTELAVLPDGLSAKYNQETLPSGEFFFPTL